MQTEPRARFYHPELDGLRFIAFLLVFIHNTLPILSNPFLKKIAEYGWIGVDLFFCLSAFLITKLLVMEYEQTGKINVRNFYIRRVLRIWPLYFSYIAIASLYTFQTIGWNNFFSKHMIGLITFSYNFVYLFLTSKIIFIVVHLWTISYEEQFYAIIPWVLSRLFNAAVNKTWILLGIFFILATSIRGIFIYLKVPHPAIYMLPLTHFEAILGGVILGLGLLDRLFEKIHKFHLTLVTLLLFSSVLLLPNVQEIGWELMLTYLFSGLGVTLFVYAATKKSDTITTRILTNRVTISLGKISYGLYVFHLICLIWSDWICVNALGISYPASPTYAEFEIPIALTMTMVLASLSYQLIEKPFLKFKERFTYIASRPI
jgi:peptidoglycan/LPS O-acetylase OafA/YrhL